MTFSSDGGNTWSDFQKVPGPMSQAGKAWHVEGNACVDYDADAVAVKVIESGWHFKPGNSYRDGMVAVFRHSLRWCRTWVGEVSPPQWAAVPYRRQ